MKTGFTGTNELRKKLNSLENNLVTKDLMKRLSLQGITLIFENTVEKGRDKTGKPFKKYSKSYLDTKKARAGKFFSPGVNLFDKGQMMSNLDHKVLTRNKAFLNFPKSEENLKALGHTSGSRFLPKRDFFGFTSGDEQKLINLIDQHIGKQTNG